MEKIKAFWNNHEKFRWFVYAAVGILVIGMLSKFGVSG